jgi:hypothetical protein
MMIASTNVSTISSPVENTTTMMLATCGFVDASKYQYVDGKQRYSHLEKFSFIEKPAHSTKRNLRHRRDFVR